MSATGRSNVRIKGDAYMTPPELSRFLVELLHRDGWVSRGQRILEPSAGTGNFLGPIREVLEPRELWANDLDADTEAWRAYGANTRSKRDFAKLVEEPRRLPSLEFDAVLGNPPYSLALEHIKLALRVLVPGGVLAYLLRLPILESKDRAQFWKDYPPSHIYVLAERPSFTGNGTDSTAYGWFCFRKSRPLHATTIEIVSWKPNRKGKA